MTAEPLYSSGTSLHTISNVTTGLTEGPRETILLYTCALSVIIYVLGEAVRSDDRIEEDLFARTAVCLKCQTKPESLARAAAPSLLSVCQHSAIIASGEALGFDRVSFVERGGADSDALPNARGPPPDAAGHAHCCAECRFVLPSQQELGTTMILPLHHPLLCCCCCGRMSPAPPSPPRDTTRPPTPPREASARPSRRPAAAPKAPRPPPPQRPP